MKELDVDCLTPEQRWQRQIDTVADTYGFQTLKLACCAAFPHTLTADLLYCLRDNFAPKAPWYAVGDILLSTLCMRGSRDLYSIEMSLRELLLKRLIDDYGEKVIDKLQDFMGDYIQHRITLDPSDRAKVLEQNLDWLPLACMKPGKAYEKIQADLLALAERDIKAELDPRERYRLAALVDSFASLPAMQVYRSIFLEWSQLTRQGEPIQSEGRIDEIDEFKQQPPFSKEITPVSKSEHQSGSNDELNTLTFRTIKVNERGNVIDRPECSARYFEEEIGETEKIYMIAIPSGRFLMGSPGTEAEKRRSESPQHWVTVPPFFMSQYPITQRQWRFIAQQPKIEIELKNNPRFQGDRLPIERVSWFDAIEFCKRLSAYTRRDEYRLPTESEWEYACRAKSTTPFAFGETLTAELANYNAKYIYGGGSRREDQRRTTEVGSFSPNAFGLYDMHGNVWEWCQDHWHDNYQDVPDDGSAWLTDDNSIPRILRGGSCSFSPANCRSARRNKFNPHDRDFNLGFRVVCAVPRNS